MFLNEEISSGNPASVKTTMVLTLQIFLLLFLIISCSGFTSNGHKMIEEEPSDVNDKESLVDVIPIKLPKICWGSPLFCIDMETTVKITRKEKEKRKKRISYKKRKSHPCVTCYKNIRIIMTKDCSRFQPIDFSDVRISNFCIGGHVPLNGTVTIFNTIRRPFSIITNITKVSNGHKNKHECRSQITSSRSNQRNVHVLETNGCTLFGSFLGLRRSGQRGCPIPWGKAPLNCILKTPLFDEQPGTLADFIPDWLGTGKFTGKSQLQFPKGRACVEFAFNRVKTRRPEKLLWKMNE